MRNSRVEDYCNRIERENIVSIHCIFRSSVEIYRSRDCACADRGLWRLVNEWSPMPRAFVSDISP